MQRELIEVSSEIRWAEASAVLEDLKIDVRQGLTVYERASSRQQAGGSRFRLRGTRYLES